MEINYNEIRIGEDNEPVDFGKHISNLLSSLLRNYCEKEKAEINLDTLIKDIQLQDFEDIKEKLNSGYFSELDQFTYLLVKSLHYSNTFEAIERGSKINDYLDQLDESKTSSKLVSDLISLIYLALLNSVIQVMYAATYVIMEKELSKQEYEEKMAEALNQSKNLGTFSQLVGGATYLASDSEKIRNLGLASIAFGFYSNYKESDNVKKTFHSEFEQINESLNKSYTDILSHLVTGAQISTRLFGTKIDDANLYKLVSRVLEKWTVCCKFCFTRNEFKGFLIEHFLIGNKDQRIRNFVASKFSYITDTTDVNLSDFDSFPDLYKESKKIHFKFKAMPWLMGLFSIICVLTLNRNAFIGILALLIVFVCIGLYFRINKEFREYWLAISSKYDGIIGNLRFYKA